MYTDRTKIGMVRRVVSTFMFAALDSTHHFMCLGLSMLVRYDVADVGLSSLYSCLLGLRCAEFDAASVGHECMLWFVRVDV